MVKWTGVVVCSLIAAAWAAGYWWRLGYLWADAGESWRAIDVDCGAFAVSWGSKFGQFYSTGWFTARNENGFLFWLPRYHDFEGVCKLWIPPWIPFVVTALLTVLFFWRDRRARSGHGPACSYNLTGLTDAAPCPECGRPDQKAHS